MNTKVQDGFRNRTVREVFQAHTGRQIDKWQHYFDIYEKHFAKYVGKSPRVLEIGVDHGGSLQMWKEYFGPGALIVGVDINPVCKTYEEDQIHVVIADQKDPNLATFGPLDIVIDDGSHDRGDQYRSLCNLWRDTTGVYLIEDCHGDYPLIPGMCHGDSAIVSRYPWVLVLERPKRIIKGEPSRRLRDDEVEAAKLYREAT